MLNNSSNSSRVNRQFSRSRRFEIFALSLRKICVFSSIFASSLFLLKRSCFANWRWFYSFSLNQIHWTTWTILRRAFRRFYSDKTQLRQRLSSSSSRLNKVLIFLKITMRRQADPNQMSPPRRPRPSQMSIFKGSTRCQWALYHRFTRSSNNRPAYRTRWVSSW